MNMMIDPNMAASAYANSQRIAVSSSSESEDTSSSSGSGSSGGVSFADLVKGKAEDALDTMRASEVMSAKAITGEADITKVVEAVTAAEVTLQTVVALRDRMISSYQEIMRMPI